MCFSVLYLFFAVYLMFSDVSVVHAENPKILYSVFKKEIFDCYLHEKGIYDCKAIYKSCYFQGLFDQSHYWFFHDHHGAVLTSRNLSQKIYSNDVNLLISNNIIGNQKPQYFGHFLKFYEANMNYHLNDFFETLVNFHPETQTFDDKHSIKFYNLMKRQAQINNYLSNHGDLLHSSFYSKVEKDFGDTLYAILDQNISEFKFPNPNNGNQFTNSNMKLLKISNLKKN